MSEITKDSLVDLIDEAIALTERCTTIQWNDFLNTVHSDMTNELPLFKQDVESGLITVAYYSLFSGIIDRYNKHVSEFIKKIERGIDRNTFTPNYIGLNCEFLHLRNLLSDLGYFNSNVVIVGANGSGKTMLSNELKKKITSKNNVVIPAQKILIIPSYSNVPGSRKSTSKLKEFQDKARNTKTTFDVTKEDSIPYQYMVDFGAEFKIILDNLLSENNELVHKRDAMHKVGEVVDYNEKSKLEITLDIWQSIIKHRKIECLNGYELKVLGEDISPYNLYDMSDGEKIVLYNIAHVIQAPLNSIITIDEPEMYLHRTITNQLWNILEEVRSDCLFIYLTHDLDFAMSRVSAKKMWIKSYTFDSEAYVRGHMHTWDIQELPESDIPEELLLKLVGSRKDILFCEGTETNSFDKQIYEILFPNLTVISVDSCKDVINFTRSYNQLPSVTQKAKGIIDKDHRTPEQITALANDHIYTLPFAEIENIFLQEGFLKAYMEKYDYAEDTFELIKKDVILLLNQHKELQISNFISSKINFYFSESHMHKANNKANINNNLERFNREIKIEDWYTVREQEIAAIITSSDYNSAIRIYNNKGLVSAVNKHLRISNYYDKALVFIKRYDVPKEIIRNCLSYYTQIVN